MTTRSPGTERIARISGESMTQVMAEGTFFDRYKRYFRFSAQEMEEQRFGMLGCDLHCSYCQNWVTSQALRDPQAISPPIDVDP